MLGHFDGKHKVGGNGVDIGECLDFKNFSTVHFEVFQQFLQGLKNIFSKFPLLF